MPLQQPKRHNPLMRRYFQEINIPGARLARRCGVSHSQVYMARKRNVGADNAEKISRGVAGILGLSEDDRLQLKAEIMGFPGDVLRAYLGTARRAALLLDVHNRVAEEIIDEGKAITHKSGARALTRLREMGAPDFVIDSVDRRLMPPPEPRRGLITHDHHGPEWKRRLREARERRETGKPKTWGAVKRSGLMLKEIYARAGVGKETMRKALYGRVGRRSAYAIAGVLGAASGLSGAEMEAIEKELREPPQDPS